MHFPVLYVYATITPFHRNPVAAYNRRFVMSELQRETNTIITLKKSKVPANSQYGGHAPSNIKLMLPLSISAKNEITL